MIREARVSRAGAVLIRKDGSWKKTRRVVFRASIGGAVDGDRTHDPLDHNQML